LEAATADVDKAANGNKAAGVRARKALQEVRTLAQELRKDISAITNKPKA
jgi:hypothetical protein